MPGEEGVSLHPGRILCSSLKIQLRARVPIQNVLESQCITPYAFRTYEKMWRKTATQVSEQAARPFESWTCGPEFPSEVWPCEQGHLLSCCSSVLIGCLMLTVSQKHERKLEIKYWEWGQMIDKVYASMDFKMLVDIWGRKLREGVSLFLFFL